MNRLWVQLTLAFALIVLVTVGVVSVVINRQADVQFRQYVTVSGMRASGTGIQRLVAFYEEQNNSWDGIESVLGDGVYLSTGMGMPFVSLDGRPVGTRGRLDVILADTRGRVVFDSAGEMEGSRLTSRQRAGALELTSSDGQQTIGYLLLSVPGRPPQLGALETQFLGGLRRALVIGALLAGGVALVAGAFLSRGLTAPLGRLADAARAVAGGDLTRRVEVEGSAEVAEVGQAFNEMTAALAEAEAHRKNLVADVAHELRTPLSVVQGSLRAILDDVYPLDKAEISLLYDETRLLSRLVDDLRELALVDAGQLCLYARCVDAKKLLETTVESLSVAAEAQEVRLELRAADDAPAVWADPDRLAQVLRNLVVNSLRHTPAGGSITVTSAPHDGVVEIAVADTGEGIAPEDLPHVFDRFWRADRARARGDRAAGGSGLGLSIAQSLVEAQGGRIWMESELGQGSVVRFTVPVAREGGGR